MIHFQGQGGKHFSPWAVEVFAWVLRDPLPRPHSSEKLGVSRYSAHAIGPGRVRYVSYGDNGDLRELGAIPRMITPWPVLSGSRQVVCGCGFATGMH